MGIRNIYRKWKEKPNCWGDENEFNPEQRICRYCRKKRSCSNKIKKIQKKELKKWKKINQ